MSLIRVRLKGICRLRHYLRLWGGGHAPCNDSNHFYRFGAALPFGSSGEGIPTNPEIHSRAYTGTDPVSKIVPNTRFQSEGKAVGITSLYPVQDPEKDQIPALIIQIPRQLQFGEVMVK